MARENRVILYGVVTEKPMICIDNETGDYKYAVGSLRVVRGARNAKDGKRYAVYAYPKIYTKNPEKIKQMETWEMNDIVNILGTFLSATINKASVCTSCHTRNRKAGTLDYIEPIFINVNEHFDTQEEALLDLRRYIFVSNMAAVIGNLARDPRRLTLSTMPASDGKRKSRSIVVCEYPLIVHRLYRVAEDPPEKDNDMIWVKTYGSNVDKDLFRLQKSSEVYIDGCLQTRFIRRHAVCDCCGAEYDWKDSTMEIVPYETEYLQRFRSQEDADRIQQERQEQSTRDILERLRQRMGMDAINETEISEGEIEDEDEIGARIEEGGPAEIA